MLLKSSLRNSFLFLSLFATSTTLLGFDASSIKNYALELDNRFNVDYKIIMAYAKTESGYNPYAINIKSNESYMLADHLRKLGFSSSRNNNYVSVMPKNEQQAIFIYDNLINNKKRYDFYKIIDYDLGIMQLNKRTIAGYKLVHRERDLYLNYRANMMLAVDIMRGCFNMFKGNITHAIECYNRGTNKSWLMQSNLQYMSRFVQNYKKIQ